MIQGTFGVIQGTFGVIQGTFGVIQGTYAEAQLFYFITTAGALALIQLKTQKPLLLLVTGPIQGTFVTFQGTFVTFQGTFIIIQGTFSTIQSMRPTRFPFRSGQSKQKWTKADNSGQ